MSFDHKLTNAKQFDLKTNGYKKVLELDYQFNTDNRDMQLEELFVYLNRDDRPLRTKIRSMSISDIVVVEDEAYYCDSFGFKPINIKNAKERGESYRIR